MKVGKDDVGGRGNFEVVDFEMVILGLEFLLL